MLSGTLRLVTSAPHLSLRIRKSISRGYSSRSSQVFGLSFLVTSPSLHTLGLRPVARLQLHPPPPFPPPQLAPDCSLPAVVLRSLYKNLPRLRPSSWPLLMPLWHTLRRPLTRVASTHYPLLPLGTASSPGPLPVCWPILSLPSSG